MAHKVFVNLPVKDLKKSVDFFTALGLSFNPMFTDNTAACLVFSEDGYAMLLTHDKWREFNNKEICDTQKSAEVMVCLSADSKEAVMDMVEKAIGNGGSAHMPPKDYGFMYQHGFMDPDSHIWEVIWMDISKFPAQS